MHQQEQFEKDVGTETDEDTFSFCPLDSSLSYSASATAFEIIPTVVAESIPFRDRVTRERYGSPFERTQVNIRHVSGKKIDPKHAQFALSAGMMLGVRECVGGVSGVSLEKAEQTRKPSERRGEEEDKCMCNDDELSPSTSSGPQNTLEEECARVQKYEFPAGAHIVTSTRTLPFRYKFKTYAPLVFAKIRASFGVEKQRFLHSICGKDNFIEFVSNAKSRQFFFYSHDGRFMIKTQTHEESRFLCRILPHYYKYIIANPHSFITHFYGMYRVIMPDLDKKSPLHFVIMKSVFNSEKEIHKIWDLKGSTQGRRAKRGEAVHKDLDIVDEGRKLYVGSEVKNAIMKQLKKDAVFLAKLEIMDYSLLLGVHFRTMNYDTVEIDRSESINSDISSGGSHGRSSLVNDGDCNSRAIKTNRTLWGCNESFVVQGDSVVQEGREIMERVGDTFYDESLGSSDDGSISERDQDEEVISDVDSTISSYIWENSKVDSRVIQRMSSSSFDRMDIGPNPYTSRKDLGIETFSGDHRLSKEIFFCGIIDILQQYNARKWGETIMRKAAGNQESQISCVDPKTYAGRFVEFISTLLE